MTVLALRPIAPSTVFRLDPERTRPGHRRPERPGGRFFSIDEIRSLSGEHQIRPVDGFIRIDIKMPVAEEVGLVTHLGMLNGLEFQTPTLKIASPRTSGRGSTPRPGRCGAFIRPFTRRGACSAVETVTYELKSVAVKRRSRGVLWAR